MGSLYKAEKPHAIFIPYPAQGHISPMLKLAKLLHNKGFHITFVNTEYNHKRHLKARGPNSLDGLPDFQFRTIPDGLPTSEVKDATQDVPSLCYSTSRNCLAPLCSLISEINSSHMPPVSCVVGDGVMTFTVLAARQFGIPIAIFWTASACGCLGYMQYRKLVEQGIVPLKGINILFWLKFYSLTSTIFLNPTCLFFFRMILSTLSINSRNFAFDFTNGESII